MTESNHSKLTPFRLPKVWGAFLGNFFEHYDTALFTALAPFIAHLFFPHDSPLAALIYTYALIPLGMLARPVGAFLFGQIGDRFSRETALFYSMAGMALISFLLAFCPTYEMGGIWGAVFLGIGRFLQNLCASGESMGGAIYILEKTPQEKHDLFSSLFSLSTVGGILTASLAVSVLYLTIGVVEGWRLLYLIGGATGLCGLVLRKDPKLEWKEGRGVSPSKTPLGVGQVLWNHRYLLALIAFASGFSYATFTVGLVLMNGFIPQISEFSKGEMVQLNVFLLSYMMIILPIFGKIAAKVSRRVLMAATSAIVLFTAPSLFSLLEEGSFVQIVAIRTVLVTLGVAFSASFHAWLQTLVPKAHRYLIISMGYALGTQLLGGPCSSVSLGIFYLTGITWTASIYWGTLAGINGALLLLHAYSKDLFSTPQEDIPSPQSLQSASR